MRFLVRKAPDRFIESVNNEISSLLNRHLDSYFSQADCWENANNFSMPVEISDKGNEFNIKAELPGVKKENLDIDIEEDYLKINAKKIENKEEKENGYKHSEFNYGEFSRIIQLPKEIDIDKTEAKLENGVLEIIAPKIKKEKDSVKKLIVK